MNYKEAGQKINHCGRPGGLFLSYVEKSSTISQKLYKL